MFAFPDISFGFLILAFLVTVFGGFTKGVTGFALPMIMMSGMANFLPIELAIASMIIPTFVSNIWQALRQGWRLCWESAKKHRVLIGTTLIGIFVFAQLLGGLEIRTLFFLLGVAIFVTCAVQLAGLRLNIPPHRRQLGALITGMIAGFFGSIAGSWGPPTMIYLLAIETPKAEQVRTAGISFGLGALVFWIAHQRTGLVTPEALGLSAFLLIPMFIGLVLGAKTQDRIDQATFRKLTLWVLLIASLNILRRAFMG